MAKKESVWLNLYFVKAVEVTPEVLQRVSEETGEQCENVLDVVKEIFNDGGDLALELVGGVDDVSVNGAFGVDGVYAQDPRGATVSMVGDTKEDDCLITGLEAVRGEGADKLQ